MNELLFATADARLSWRMVLLSLLVAYVLAQAIAGVYAYGHRGLSYSRSMVLTLVATGILACALMLAIGGSIARGIGIVGTLALIRFRTNLHDPLDIVFVLASFGAGVAAGTGNFTIGVLGTGFFLLVLTLLRFSTFGVRHRFDGVLQLQLPCTPEAETAISELLREHCHSFALVTLRDVAQGRGVERVYQVTLRRPREEGALIGAVSALPEVCGVSLSMQEATLEL